MTSLLKLSRGIDVLTEWVGRIFAWAVVLASVVSALNALLRRLAPEWSSNGLLELQWYLFGATFLLCAAWTWKSNGHVRIDIISSRLSAKARNRVEMFCHFFFLLPFLAVMCALTPKFFYSTYAIHEVSSSPGGLIIWPAKALIMAGFYLLALQWISEVIKRAAIMRGAIPDAGMSGHLADAQEEAERLLSGIGGQDDAPPDGENGNNGQPRS